MSDESPLTLKVTRSVERAQEWALVLTSQGLSPVVQRRGDGWHVELPLHQQAESEWALAALDSYEQENPPRTEDPLPDPDVPPPFQMGTVVAATLAFFFLVTGPRAAASPWFETGSANAERILAGEWWRLVTALTLHADLGHVAANAILGTFVVNAVCRALGPGVGLLAVVAAGALGNAANAGAHGSFHDSVGASTAVFAGVGLLAALAVARRHSSGSRGPRLLVPLAAGLGILAMLGVGGGQTDVWAHAFGLVSGALTGLPLAYGFARAPATWVQWLCGAAAVVCVVGSWRVALLS